jgi:hypothetical protein
VARFEALTSTAAVGDEALAAVLLVDVSERRHIAAEWATEP